VGTALSTRIVPFYYLNEIFFNCGSGHCTNRYSVGKPKGSYYGRNNERAIRFKNMQFQTQDGVLGSGVDPPRVNQMELASETLQNNPVSSHLILASKFGGTKIRSITEIRRWKWSLLILKDSKPTISNNKGIIRRKKKRYQVEYQASKLVVLWNERMEPNLIPNQIAPTSCTSSTTTVVLAGHQS